MKGKPRNAAVFWIDVQCVLLRSNKLLLENDETDIIPIILPVIYMSSKQKYLRNTQR